MLHPNGPGSRYFLLSFGAFCIFLRYCTHVHTAAMKRKANSSAAAASVSSGGAAAGSQGGKAAKRATPAAAAAAAALEGDYDINSSGTESDDLDMTRRGGGGADDASSDEDGSDDSEGDSDDSDTIRVEFSFMDPSDSDYKSVRRLREKYLPGQEKTFDASSMSDAIIKQRAVGTMLKVTDDLDVYGFATVLSVARYQVCRLRSTTLHNGTRTEDQQGRTRRFAVRAPLTAPLPSVPTLSHHPLFFIGEGTGRALATVPWLLRRRSRLCCPPALTTPSWGGVRHTLTRALCGAIVLWKPVLTT